MTLDLDRLMKEGGVTRDGHIWRILCTDGPGAHSIVGVSRTKGVGSWGKSGEGNVLCESLHNLPYQPREWCLVWPPGVAYESDKKEKAQAAAELHRGRVFHVREVMEDEQ